MEFGSALIGAVGSIGSGIASALGASDANDEALELFGKQKHFSKVNAKKAYQRQKKFWNRQIMPAANTAYQRAMEDMKNAGLNPILAYKQGGAQTPSAPNVAGAQTPAAPTIRNELEQGLGMAQAANAYAQISNTEAQTKLLNAQATSERVRANRLERFDPIYERIGDFIEGADRAIDQLAPYMRDPKQLVNVILELLQDGQTTAQDGQTTQPQRKVTEAVREVVTQKVKDKFNETVRGSKDPISWKEYQRLRRLGISIDGRHEIDRRQKELKKKLKEKHLKW